MKKLNKELAAFNVKMEENMSEQQRLKDEADIMQKRLAAAEKLIKGLASERTRWTADLEELAKVRERLLGDCLLTSSFLSYTGAFTFDFRQKLTYELWLSDVRDRDVPVTVPLTVTDAPVWFAPLMFAPVSSPAFRFPPASPALDSSICRKTCQRPLLSSTVLVG